MSASVVHDVVVWLLGALLVWFVVGTLAAWLVGHWLWRTKDMRGD
jgi:hypothetical protein